ncbi:unnamed protein product, partial [Ectocarpus sp. 12 AP-2014]
MSAVLRFLNHKSYPFGQYEELVPYIKQFYPDLTGLNINSEENYYTKIRTYITIIRRLFIVYADRETIVSYKLDVFEDMVASFPKRLQNYKFQLSGYHHSITANWANIITSYAGDLSVGEINLLSNEDLKRFWDIQMYLVAQDFGHPDTVTDIQEITREKRNSGNLNFPDVEVTLRLYKAGFINDDDLLFQALYSNDLMTIIDGGYNYRIRRGTLTENLVPKHVFLPLKTNLLETELERGDLVTPATEYIFSINTVEGVDYVFKVLQRLGKDTFERGYSYYGNSKKSLFSAILKKTTFKETESYA